MCSQSMAHARDQSTRWTRLKLIVPMGSHQGIVVYKEFLLLSQDCLHNFSPCTVNSQPTFKLLHLL